MGFGNAKAERPYDRTIKWRSSEDRFEFYDGEENQPVEIESFIVLEEMVSVSGYHNGQKAGIWSNEVLSLDDSLDVRIGNDIAISGPWKIIKNEVGGMGGKFTNVVIALLPDGEIVRFLFSGAACSGWIGKKFNPMARQCGVRFNGSDEDQNGSVTFNVPRFIPVALDDEQKEDAIEKWKTVEEWLQSRGVERNEHNQEVPNSYEQDIPENTNVPDGANSEFQQASSVPGDCPF